MKNFILLLLLSLAGSPFLNAQDNLPERERKSIVFLIDQYSEAREKMDTGLLKTILTTDVDQLVSTGEWRNGIDEAVQGMVKSSTNSPGTRTLKIDKIRMFNVHTALVDCKYEIQHTDGSTRKMWSTFLVVENKEKWKITAIRNMLPAGQ